MCYSLVAPWCSADVVAFAGRVRRMLRKFAQDSSKLTSFIYIYIYIYTHIDIQFAVCIYIFVVARGCRRLQQHWSAAFSRNGLQRIAIWRTITTTPR